jgi:hypothetical protein
LSTLSTGIFCRNFNSRFSLKNIREMFLFPEMNSGILAKEVRVVPRTEGMVTPSTEMMVTPSKEVRVTSSEQLVKRSWKSRVHDLSQMSRLVI